MGREGRLDFRKTVRASLGTGGVPVITHHRPRKVHKPELVVLCDVSGSVAGFSHFTLMLTQALREHFTGVRAFALDRKSTRLNSSHANISYAVFCLKKKTIYHDSLVPSIIFTWSL